MAANKTQATGASVQDYLAAIDGDDQRKDCQALAKLMAKATGQRATMWGASIVGFGSYHYQYESGREGDSCVVGFSSRQGKISLYGLRGAPDADRLLARLGKHQAGKGCISIKTLDDIDMAILEKLIASAAATKKSQPATSED